MAADIPRTAANINVYERDNDALLDNRNAQIIIHYRGRVMRSY